MVALLGAGLTAFYMTRLMVMTFFGEKRWADDVHPHESPRGDDRADDPCSRSARSLGGFLLARLPAGDWLAPVLGEREEVDASGLADVLTVTLLVVAVALLPPGGCFSGAARCPRRPGRVTPLTARRPPRPLLRRGERGAVHAAGQVLTRALVCLDNRGIDGAVNGPAAGSVESPARLRRAQTGFVRSTHWACSAAPSLVAGRCSR